MYFHFKMAWPPATYDIISRNHRNWPLLNLTQNARERWTNSYWKHQVLMFYPLEKKLRKTLYARGLGKNTPSTGTSTEATSTQLEAMTA